MQSADEAAAGSEPAAARQSELDQRYLQALQSFDADLRRANVRTSAGTSTRDDGATGTGGGIAGASLGLEEEQAQGDGSGRRSAAGSIGNGNNTARYPAPQNMPGGADDDIVARQLREAAETESDPELREKLWQEYLQYKNARR